MSTPRKHHIVPKGYLRGFAIPRGSESVCVFSVADHSVFTTNIDNVCAERDYYAASLEDGTKTTELESYLANLDDVFARILRKVANGKELSATDRYDFAAFVATQYLRTPHMKSFASSAIGSLTDHLMMVTASDPKRFHESWNAMVKDTGFTPEIDPEEIRMAALSGEFKAEGTHEASVAMALAPLNDITKICFRMKWTFFFTSQGSQFLTCDNPVGFFHPWLLTTDSPPPGLVHEDTNLHVPVSPSVYAIGGWKLKNGYAEIPRNKIREVNKFGVLRADRHVILPYNNPALIRFVVGVLEKKRELQSKAETAEDLSDDGY